MAKRTLVTWYGITDLSAAMGVVNSGPVFDALRRGDYQAAIILCYTDPDKDEPEIQSGIEYSPADIRRVANSQVAHTHFKSWLESSLASEGVNVQLRTYSAKLAHLNDTDGIFKAAAFALKMARDEYSASGVDVFLSPGTPAMAFTWGMAALVNKRHDIRAIASSDPTKPPAAVNFPSEMGSAEAWVDAPSVIDDMTSYDVVYHLFGEQRIPAGIVLREFDCGHHVFVTDRNYQSKIMRKLLRHDGRKEDLFVDPFDPKSVENAITLHARTQPSGTRFGFNLTGGTKLMYTGGLAAAMTIGGVPFYLDGRHQNVVRVDTWETKPYQGLRDVEDYLMLSGLAVKDSGRWESLPFRQTRLGHTRNLWSVKSKLARIYKSISHYNDEVRPFSISQRGVEATLSKQMEGMLNIDGKRMDFPNQSDFAKYVSGGWLEEYVYDLVQPLFGTDIFDVRIGACVKWPGTNQDAQEFDVLATNGNRLFIIECKAGAVRAEDIYKLQQNVRAYGGVEAHGILAAAFSPSPAIRRRIEADRRLSLACGASLKSSLFAALRVMNN